MPALPVNPIDNPQAWDAFEFAGVEYSFCEYSGFERVHKWDEKEGKGAKGATNTYTNDPLAKGSITFYAWESEHFTLFSTILEILRFDPTKKQGVATDVWHPALVEQEINSLVVTSQAPWHHDGQGMYTRTLEFSEFRPPPKTSAVATPKASATTDPNATPGTGGSPGVQPDPAIAAAKAEFDQALADAKAKGAP